MAKYTAGGESNLKIDNKSYSHVKNSKNGSD